MTFDVEKLADGVYVELPDLEKRPRSVADAVVETLVAHGVTHVFDVVGHLNVGFAETLRRAEDRGQLTYVGIRHEGDAAFVASAYGKLTALPAACFAIAGPGSTNPLNGLYDAKLDQVPVVAISGRVPADSAQGPSAGGPAARRRRGRGVASTNVTRRLLAEFAAVAPRPHTTPAGPTRREHEVLTLVARTLSNQDT